MLNQTGRELLSHRLAVRLRCSPSLPDPVGARGGL